MATFAELPAVAVDETPEKAMLRLISIFEVLLQEQKELIYERIIKKQIEQAVQSDPSYQLVQFHGSNRDFGRMKLQMVS